MAIQGPGGGRPPHRAARPGLEEEAMMVRLPDAAGQVRNVPVKVLRGFFAGIGRLLLAADRVRAEEVTSEQAGDSERYDSPPPPGRVQGENGDPESQPPDPAKFR